MKKINIDLETATEEEVVEAIKALNWRKKNLGTAIKSKEYGVTFDKNGYADSVVYKSCRLFGSNSNSIHLSRVALVIDSNSFRVRDVVGSFRINRVYWCLVLEEPVLCVGVKRGDESAVFQRIDDDEGIKLLGRVSCRKDQVMEIVAV